MLLTVALVCAVIFLPAVAFSLGGVDFRLMSYGIAPGGGPQSGIMLFYGGEETGGGVMTSMLSICTVAMLGLAALVPFVAIFCFRNRMLQVRLLAAEFVLLVGGMVLLGWYIFSTYRGVVSQMSENFFFSFFPLLLVPALMANWFAVRGVVRDERMVRAADRVR